MIDEYVAAHGDKAIAFTSLGQRRYLSALHYIDAVVGNSSSGIVEAPTFKVASINMGDRQKGRIRASSVIDIAANSSQIKSALVRIYDEAYQAELANVVNPYGDGDSSEKVVEVLRTVDLSSLVTKSFYDVSF